MDILIEAYEWIYPLLLKHKTYPIEDCDEEAYSFLIEDLYLNRRELTEEQVIKRLLKANFIKRVSEEFINRIKGKKSKDMAGIPGFNTGIATDFESWYESTFDDSKVSGPKIAEFSEWLKTPMSYNQLREVSAEIDGLGLTAEHWELLVKDTRYVGFDARIVATILWKISQNLGDGAEGIHNPFYADMVFLIVLFLQRGTSVIDPKKIGTMAQDTKKKVAMLKKKYGIIAKIANAQKDTAITLSRIAACFPLITCRIMADAPVDRPVATESMQRVYPDYPKMLRNSCFFAIFYPGGKMTGIIKALLHHQHAEGMIINQKNADYKKKTSEERMEEVIKYANATFRSEVVSLEERKKACSKYFGSISMTQRKSWSERFDTHFPGQEENIDTFFEQGD